MSRAIFFSWQLDTPSEIGRDFIEGALAQAIRELSEEFSVNPASREEGTLTIDRDTKDVAGTPPIVDTIFRKIDAAGAFLVDLTFVGKRLDGRPTPNPNVLLEYGWALRSRGYERIICVMNTAYGKPTDKNVPFNMKHLRKPFQYRLKDATNSAEIDEVRSGLVRDLKIALSTMSRSGTFADPTSSPPEPPRFVPARPVDGQARFRKHKDPIGVLDSRYALPTAGQVMLADGPALWLRVMPDVQLDQLWSISELRHEMSRSGPIYPPGYFTAWTHVRGADGFGVIPHASNDMTVVPAVSFVFQTGEIWSIFTGPRGLTTDVGFLNPERMLTTCFVGFVRFMRDGLKIPLPYRWIAGIEGINGKGMERVGRPGYPFPGGYMGPCQREMVSDSGLLKEGDKVQLALKAFFQELYDACGERREDYMDAPLLAVPDTAGPP
jgi:hypothetical protein